MHAAGVLIEGTRGNGGIDALVDPPPGASRLSSPALRAGEENQVWENFLKKSTTPSVMASTVSFVLPTPCSSQMPPQDSQVS